MNNGSRPITAFKLRLAWLVRGLVIACERHVLLSLILDLSNYIPFQPIRIEENALKYIYIYIYIYIYVYLICVYRIYSPLKNRYSQINF